MRKRTVYAAALTLIASVTELSYAEQDSAKPGLPSTEGVLRIGLQQVGNKDLNIPLPDIYPLTANSSKSGPDHSWHQVTFIPEPSRLPAWDEMISLLILPSNLPARPTQNASALQILEAGLNRECIEKAGVTKAAVPNFTTPLAEAEAITIKCRSMSKSEDKPYVGYHVAVKNGDYIYVLSRTAIEHNSGGISDLLKDWPSPWVKAFNGFAVCPLNEACSLYAKKK